MQRNILLYVLLPLSEDAAILPLDQLSEVSNYGIYDAQALPHNTPICKQDLCCMHSLRHTGLSTADQDIHKEGLTNKICTEK